MKMELWAGIDLDPWKMFNYNEKPTPSKWRKALGPDSVEEFWEKETMKRGWTLEEYLEHSILDLDVISKSTMCKSVMEDWRNRIFSSVDQELSGELIDHFEENFPFPQTKKYKVQKFARKVKKNMKQKFKRNREAVITMRDMPSEQDFDGDIVRFNYDDSENELEYDDDNENAEGYDLRLVSNMEELRGVDALELKSGEPIGDQNTVMFQKLQVPDLQMGPTNQQLAKQPANMNVNGDLVNIGGDKNLNRDVHQNLAEGVEIIAPLFQNVAGFATGGGDLIGPNAFDKQPQLQLVEPLPTIIQKGKIRQEMTKNLANDDDDSWTEIRKNPRDLDRQNMSDDEDNSDLGVTDMDEPEYIEPKFGGGGMNA